MQLSWDHLQSLPVQTQSGQKLGLVEGVSIDIDNHKITQYQVKPSTILASLFKKPFLIAPAQVISITEQVMIVTDSVAATDPATNQKQTRLASAPAKSEMNLRD